MNPHIALEEHAARRARVLEALGSALGLVFAGRADAHGHEPFRPHPHFEYLTGIADEPEAALLLDPSNPDPKRRQLLFLAPVDPEMSQWDGLRDTIGAALKARTGFESIYRRYALPRFLLPAAKRARKLACLHPLAPHTSPVSEDLAVWRQVAERIPGCGIEDQSELLARHRARKSPAEIAMVRKAIAITATGFDAAMRTMRPGMREFEVQETLEHAFRTQGSRRLAFGTIAGAGLNATVLHYRANHAALEPGQLVCLDAGASWGGYAADITRTVPVGGRFTSRQREVYGVVLAAHQAAIAATKPGARFHEVDQAARTVIERAGFGDAFPHGIGHHLGLETHDITPDEPLAPGAVITIEPGVYLASEALGVRIEDDVLVTETGREVLSDAIPRGIDEIERIMGRG